MRGADVLQAAEACRELLNPTVDASWGVPVPGLEMTVAQVVAHAANAPLWYALDLWSGPDDDAAFEVSDTPTPPTPPSCSACLTPLGCARQA